jgi:hypothetical protein
VTGYYACTKYGWHWSRMAQFPLSRLARVFLRTVHLLLVLRTSTNETSGRGTWRSRGEWRHTLVEGEEKE